jgi:hypothetical protein
MNGMDADEEGWLRLGAGMDGMRIYDGENPSDPHDAGSPEKCSSSGDASSTRLAVLQTAMSGGVVTQGEAALALG